LWYTKHRDLTSLRKECHHQIGQDRATDRALLELARREERIIITADLDFPRLLALSAAKGPGLILFRGGNYSDAEHSTQL
jgi:predicted nuclease of predicted toxin-antitoxin system